MVLSNQDIQKALDRGWLVIDPEPSPRKPGGTHKCPYDTTAVDLRLGDEIITHHPLNPHKSIDLREGGFEKIAAMQTKSEMITDSHPYHLAPGAFVLGKTLERVELPILPRGRGRQLAARIEGKSSFARVGLLVHFTAPTIHAGFAGVITLEMANFGPYEIILKPRMYICQLIVEDVSGVPFRNDSSFQGQFRPAGQRR